jgi:hypothetical protein
MAGDPIDRPAGGRCRACRHFTNRPMALERAIAGLASFGSGYASVLADNGLCRHHQRLRHPDDGCAAFAACGAAEAGATSSPLSRAARSARRI